MPTEQLAFDITARDHASSAFRKVASEADRTAAALKRSQKISDDVAKAETRLSKARDGEADSMGRVRVAEQRLQELRDKGLQGSARFAAAEESLATSRRKAAQSSNTAVQAEQSLSKARTKLVADAAAAGRDAGSKLSHGFGDGVDKEGAGWGKRFGKSVLHWISGAGGDLKKAGEESGSIFSSGLQGTLKTPVIGPAIIVAAVAAVESAAIPAGAILAGGVVAGFGGGIAALGLKFAAESDRVKAIWSKTASDLGASMRTISKPFENTLVAMSLVARREFATFKPELSAAFKSLAPAVAGFGDQLGRAFGKLAPAIQPLAGAFKGVLGALGPALNDVFSKLATSLIKLSDSVAKNPTALADFARGVGNIAGDLLGLITHLNDADAAFKRLTGISAVTAAMGTLRTAVGLVIAPIDLLSQGFSKVADGIKWAIDRQFPGQAKAAADSTTTFATSLFTTAAAIQKATSPSAVLAETVRRQTAATQAANDALTRQSNLLLGLSGSEIAYQQAVDDATQSVKENGHTHDITTEKGRNNQRALDQIAASATAQAVASRNAGKASVSAAEGARDAYVKQAVQMGYTKTEAQRMAAQFIKIPKKTVADFKGDIVDLDGKIAKAKRELKDPKLTPTKKAKLEATIAQLLGAKKTAQGAIDSLHGKTVPINVVTRYTSVGSRSSGGGVGGGHEITGKGSAAGGLIPGPPSRVDNHLRPMATGEFVVQASKVPGNLATLNAINTGSLPRTSDLARRMAAAGVGTSSLAPAVSRSTVVNNTININVTGALDARDAGMKIAQILRHEIRVTGGGDVQRVLGQS